MLDLMACQPLEVPAEIMRHVVKVESAFNRFAIGVVGGRLSRQPSSLDEAVAAARGLEAAGRNFSVGLAQINRYNLERMGLTSYEQAFAICPNLRAGARILAQCQRRHGEWGKAFSCYYSGNAVTGFRHGYVQKVVASLRNEGVPVAEGAAPIELSMRRAQRPGTGGRRVMDRRRGKDEEGAPEQGSDAAFVF